MTRWRASGIHFLISVFIAMATFGVMLLVWYPRPLFEAAGGGGLLFIMVIVDVVIGPLMTLIIFRAGKWGLRFDLYAIATLQLAALAYGAHIMLEARPVFLVLVKDQFEVVTEAQIPPQEFALAKRPEYRHPSHLGPLLVYAEFTDRERKDVVLSLMAGGPDIHQRPKFYVPYGERRKEALEQARPLDQARKDWPETKEAIDRFLADTGRREADVVYLSGRAPVRWFIALLDAKTGDVLRLVLAGAMD